MRLSHLIVAGVAKFKAGVILLGFTSSTWLMQVLELWNAGVLTGAGFIIMMMYR